MTFPVVNYGKKLLLCVYSLVKIIYHSRSLINVKVRAIFVLRVVRSVWCDMSFCCVTVDHEFSIFPRLRIPVQ